MAQSRKDSRGYALRMGESQRADGRYSYSYTDHNSKRHTVYGKDLVELRKKEQKIRRDLEDGLIPRERSVSQSTMCLIRTSNRNTT